MIKRRFINTYLFGVKRKIHVTVSVIIRLEDRRPPNIGFTLLGNLAVFTSSAIIPPKFNRFG